MAIRKLDAAAIAAITRRINAIPDRLKVAARAELKAQAEAMAENMRRAVPVETGTLRDTIKVEDVSDGQWVARFRITAGGAATSKPIRKSRKGNAPLYDYAKAIEFGHKDPDGSHVPSQPYFYPAYRLGKKRARSAVSRAVKRAAEAGNV